jgi:hypothetical protein
MSDPATAKDRPPQVTVAAWLIMVGSVFVVLMAWDRIAGLHSLDSRHALQSKLSEPWLKGTGLQVTDLMAMVKTFSMVAAASATAMTILGYQALQRSRGARLALAVLAVPLFLTDLLAGGFLSSGIAVAVAMLWLPQARTWFDGGVPVRAGSTPRPTERTGTPSEQTAAPVERTAPPGMAAWAPPPTSVYAARPAAGFGATERSPRPAALLWASVLTWVFSGLSALTLGLAMLVLADDSTKVLDTMHQQNPDLASQGISDHMILVACFVMCAAFIAWALVAAVLAALAFRRVRWAWYALVISTTGVIGICVLGSIGSLFLLVPLAGAAAAISMLVRPEVRHWFGLR